ncbi:MAG: hypothetical protein V5B30_12735 [Candidatus Accumulibacter delftensis]|jgi:hypothetical protein
MSNVLTYVDADLARQIATGLIGSEVRLAAREGTAFGINFKVLVRRDRGVEQSTTTKVSDLLPEVVADAVNEAVLERITSLQNDRERFIAGGTRAFRPGTPVAISNAQFILDGKLGKSVLGGEPCVQYRFQVGQFYLHAYCPMAAEKVFDSLVGQPVEVVGILRYTPAYTVPGALALSLGLRVCAVWLT